MRRRILLFFVLLTSVSFLLQVLSSAAPTQNQSISCSISVSEPASGLDSISLTVNTPGHDCSFTLTALDAGGDGAECRRRRRGDEEMETNEIGGREQGEEREEAKVETGGNYLGTNQLGVEDGGNKEGGDVFTCVLDQLEPGTWYQLQVQSQRDEETANITVNTSKFWSWRLFARLTFTCLILLSL